MSTAQETFATMLRDEIAPALRDLGLTGSRSRFTVPSDTHWATIGFQKHKYSDARELEFTLNLSVADRESWDEARAAMPHLPERPAPNAMYGTFIWWRRIGQLLPDAGGDHWWTVRAGQRTGAVASEIVRIVREIALPAMREQMRDNRPSAAASA
jgi:hypothetical protein